ncbi:STAS domain-containing protein [Streptomyces sp. NBC_00252]|uniref:STAS domain-containing protein n=1 Tax=Streptomyces sp. NBC_00252 TaxID=2975691 RepID=UPI002E2CF382|nr:STAS domain-containing protein [Streptomyces sp. NBC_00252]
MTTTPPAHLRLTTVDTETTVRIELHGDLDYDNADRLMTTVSGKLAAHPRLHDLHLHCGGLDVVDSLGLSVLLMIRRRTSEAGVRLHLDARSAKLERLLTVTGTLEHLTAPPHGAADSARCTAKTSLPGRGTSARPTGPDSTT